MPGSSGFLAPRSIGARPLSVDTLSIRSRRRIPLRRRQEHSSTHVRADSQTQGYLFDRRQIGRTIRAEWGMPCDEESYVTCVRRFGRPEISDDERGIEHITGARMAQTNGHEVGFCQGTLTNQLTNLLGPTESVSSYIS